MYTKIVDALHDELEILDERYANGGKLSAADLDMIDKATHALKCLATYEAMTDRGRRYEREYRRY